MRDYTKGDFLTERDGRWFQLPTPSLDSHRTFYQQVFSSHKAFVERCLDEGQLTGFEASPEALEAAVDTFFTWDLAFVIAMPYALEPILDKDREQSQEGPSQEEPPQEKANQHVGRVSIMAWEWDYHTVLKRDLRNYLEQIGLEPSQYTVQVDSGPLPERLLGAVSGAGKLGKNQMLLHPEFGSRIYLAVLGIRNCDLEAAHIESVNQWLSASGRQWVKPVTEGHHQWADLEMTCRTCDRCQTYCPGGALVSGQGLAVNRCISAITQDKGSLTETQERLMGHQLYGCDLCQIVCPMNMAPLGAGAYVRRSKPVVPLEPLLAMSQRTFKATYGHHGFAWRGLTTLKRNAQIIIRNHAKNEGSS